MDRKYNTPSPHLQEKLRRSQENTEHIVMRDIKCPFCNFLVDIVGSDVTSGHKMIHCRKCKNDYMISYAHFRTHRSFNNKPVRYLTAKRRQSR